MMRCKRCGGSGLASVGVFSMTADCPDCNGAGWVDPNVQGPAPASKQQTVDTGIASSIVYEPGDIFEDERGQIFRLSDRRIWERVDEKPPAPAPASRVKTRPKKRGGR